MQKVKHYIMEITRENYFTERGKSSVIKTYSLSEIQEKIAWAINNAKINNKRPEDIPVFINFDDKPHGIRSIAVGWGNHGMETSIESSPYYEIKFIAPDSRPENGEYWRSRGIGGGDADPDCSGFVVSKLAGERLRRMVRLVLEKDETDSWLDYRDYEPNWIQFKFKGSEFDLEKLDKMTRENKNVVTLEILKECKKNLTI